MCTKWSNNDVIRWLHSGSHDPTQPAVVGSQWRIIQSPVLQVVITGVVVPASKWVSLVCYSCHHINYPTNGMSIFHSTWQKSGHDIWRTFVKIPQIRPRYFFLGWDMIDKISIAIITILMKALQTSWPLLCHSWMEKAHFICREVNTF